MRFACATICALATLACAAGTAPAPSSEPQPESVRAWMELEREMARMREVVVAESENDLEVTDGIEYLLVTLRMAIENSLNALEPSETLYHYTEREPLVGCPNPDQDYWTAPLDPDGRYRVYGNMGDTVYLSIVLYGYVPRGDQLTKGWGSTLEAFGDSREFAIGPDGAIELFLSPTRPEGAANWLPVTPKTREIMIREFHHDRTSEANAQLSIERLDTPTERTSTGAEQLAGGQQMLRAAELAHPRLSDAEVATWVRRVTSTADALLEFRRATEVVHEAQGVRAENRAFVVTMENAAARQVQPNPLVNYMNIRVELGEDESLVVEGRAPDAPYWGVQFCDRWKSAPGGRRTGWLNDSKIYLEPDGRYRVVVGPEDTGAPNWVDTSGHRRGTLLWRFVSGENLPEAASVRVIRTSELRGTR